MCLQCDSIKKHILSQNANKSPEKRRTAATEGTGGERRHLTARAYLLCGAVFMNLLKSKANGWDELKHSCLCILDQSLGNIDPNMLGYFQEMQLNSDSFKGVRLEKFASCLAKGANNLNSGNEWHEVRLDVEREDVERGNSNIIPVVDIPLRNAGPFTRDLNHQTE